MIMKVTFLGTGAAEGIPAINCDCHHCQRARVEGGKLQRERSAILFQLPDYNLLVEVPPNTRGLINKYQVNDLQGILATHAVYSHIGGLKEFEYWSTPLDFLAETNLFKEIHKKHWTERLNEIMFHIPYYPGAALDFGHFSLTPFAARRHQPIFGLSIKAGEKRIVYASSTPNRLTNYTRCLMAGADVLIVNTPTFEPPKEDHITLVEAIELKDQVGAKQLILTHINHNNRPHDELEEYVSQFPGVIVAYDGLGLVLSGDELLEV
jgi:phosphoribosyl 1,2-cyclic phosphate phosphodiesterase